MTCDSMSPFCQGEKTRVVGSVPGGVVSVEAKDKGGKVPYREGREIRRREG